MDERSDSLESAAAYAVECLKGLCERVVRMRETLDRSVPREEMERRCARLQRQIDESHAALRRRNARMAEISTERDELRAEVASMSKRLMPEGMEWLVEAWPRFEDDAPVRFLDGFERYGEENGVNAVTMYADGSFTVNFRAYSKGERVNRPAPKVLDADGVEIKPGDTVCGTRDMEPMRVVDTDSDEYGLKKIKCEKEGDGFWFYCPNELTHKLPVLAADGVPLEVEQTVYLPDGTPVHVTAIGDMKAGQETVFGKAGNDITDSEWQAALFTHQRPVLDADGVPIKVGDAVWEVGTVLAIPMTVVEVSSDTVRCEYTWTDGKVYRPRCSPDTLTHTKPEPDSWSSVWADVSNGNETPEGMMRRCRALAERGQR